MPHLVDRGGLRGRGGRDLRQVSALALGLRRSCLHLRSCSGGGWEAAICLVLRMTPQRVFTLPVYLDCYQGCCSLCLYCDSRNESCVPLQTASSAQLMSCPDCHAYAQGLCDTKGPTSVPVLQLRVNEPGSLQTHLASSGPDSSSTCTMLRELTGTGQGSLSTSLAVADGMGAVPCPGAPDI